jgi:hypothetical protein
MNYPRKTKGMKEDKTEYPTYLCSELLAVIP